MPIRNPVEEREEQDTRRKAEIEATRKAMAEVAVRVLNTPDGTRLFAYLAKKHHVFFGHVFLTDHPARPACPFAAARRDGATEPIKHVFALARSLDPTIPIP